MYTIQPKKLIIMNILDILKRYTDYDHRLSQKEIADILKTEYSMPVDRKAVKRNLMNLIDFGYQIEYSESVRMVPNSKTGELEESCILSDFYIEGEFSDAELRLLIDSMLFSKHIPYAQCKELIEKLEHLSNKYFESKIKHIRTLPDKKAVNKQLFYTIDILDEAISKGKQVKFCYTEYYVDKKLYPRKNDKGENKEYIINPYQIVATNGRYYLVCNYNKYSRLSNYRVDRIIDIELLDTNTKPIEQVDGCKNGLDIAKHMDEHIYMFSGDSVKAKFTAPKFLISDILDYFGSDVQLKDLGNNQVEVTTKINRTDMRLWATQYASQVKVTQPKDLADEIKADLLKAIEMYK